MEIKGFERLKIADRYKLIEYYSISNIEESNHNIINNYMWLSSFPLWIKEHNDVMYIVGIHNDEMLVFMPLCLPSKRKEALEYIINYLAEYDYVFSYYTEEFKELLLEIDSSFIVEELVDSFDYIYEYEKLATMSGKKLQKKRNHINAFKKENEGRYEYVTIANEHLTECLRVLDEWKARKDLVMQDEYLENEYLGIKYLLNHYHELPIKGGCIYVDGKIEAFALGSYSSNKMIQENVEKANDSIRGLYPFMTSEFLAHEFNNENIQLVNREDDLGIEAMRHAKHSLHPIYTVKKYLIRKGE